MKTSSLLALAALLAVPAAEAQPVAMDLNAIHDYLRSIRADGNCVIKTERFRTRTYNSERILLEILDRTTATSDGAIMEDARFKGSTVDISQVQVNGRPAQLFTYKRTELQSSLSPLLRSVTVKLYTTDGNALAGATIVQEHEERGWFGVKSVIDSRFTCKN